MYFIILVAYQMVEQLLPFLKRPLKIPKYGIFTYFLLVADTQDYDKIFGYLGGS